MYIMHTFVGLPRDSRPDQDSKLRVLLVRVPLVRAYGLGFGVKASSDSTPQLLGCGYHTAGILGPPNYDLH